MKTVNRGMMDACFLLWLTLFIGAASSTTTAATVDVRPDKCVILIADQDAPDQRLAAEELRKHLQLITGVNVPIAPSDHPHDGRYPFHIASPAPATNDVPAWQESRWVISSEGTWLWGDARPGSRGTQFAVYCFLEDQLGVTWIEPGDEGIVYPSMQTLKLKAGSYQWTPALVFRKIRQGHARLRDAMPPLPADYSDYAEFQLSLEQHNTFTREVIRWQERMRMGGRRPGGGHAFSTWWDRYGESHPEYFALNRFGQRRPVPLPKKEQTNPFVKICPSQPGVANQIVNDWLPKQSLVQYVNVGVDDGADNFCECEACAKLDVPLKDEPHHAHLTDRYVHLANSVAREVRKYRDDARVAMYAYLTTLYPPRRLTLEPNIVVQVVPYVIPMDIRTTRNLLHGWKEAGATMLSFRPNYHVKYLTTAMPMGIEKQMFDVFQIAVAEGCIAADYDSLTHNWPVTGITDYILARAMSDPDQPFTHWEKQYYAAFGAAADDVAEYYRYWRHNLWEQRLLPNIQTICDRGGAGDFARGLFWSLGEYYTDADFQKTQTILERASTRSLTAAERQRLNELSLANEHAHLMFQAITAPPDRKDQLADNLLTFRRKNREALKLPWIGVFAFEINNGDLSGLHLADQMKDYLKPWLPTELSWRFKLDPDDVGLTQDWHSLTWAQTADWASFRTDRFWERQLEADEINPSISGLAKKASHYDGIGWYTTRVRVPEDWQGRKILLRFGAVDESCWIYINGQAAGKHLYVDKNDWKTPFEIPINQQIVWDNEYQIVTVRVEDKQGLGGIWRRVWLVSQSK